MRMTIGEIDTAGANHGQIRGGRRVVARTSWTGRAIVASGADGADGYADECGETAAVPTETVLVSVGDGRGRGRGRRSWRADG